MNKILVPIENFSSLSLSASYFALRFARRNPTKILFLIFSAGSPGKALRSRSKKAEGWQRQFDGLIRQAREDKIDLEIFSCSHGDLDAVSQFARDHNATEIILALPQIGDPAYSQRMREINAWRSQVENQIIVVRPKEEAKGQKGSSPWP